MLEGIPDKRQDKNTTSLKFKQDVINYFDGIDSDYKCIEIGTNKGYTTRVLSLIFSEVVTMDIDILMINEAIKNNKDRENITFLQGDVYNNDWGVEGNYEVVFIDCNHSYEYVKRDIENALKYNPKYIIFDDYGLPEDNPSVKVAVDEFIKNNDVELIYIGEPAGSEPRIGRCLVDWEGVIVKL